jgi:uracil-DNA glycosylase
VHSWTEIIPSLQSGYADSLQAHIDQLRTTHTIYPPAEKVWHALELTPFDRVRAVILGQDPYHGPGQAHGLAFSVPNGLPTPPSLRNIFKEIANDLYAGQSPDVSTDLTRWARQGVLLLNATLTVEAGKAGSHGKLGWRQITDDIIETLSQRRTHLVFLLWGAHAQSKRSLINTERHLVLEAVHPSPLSAYRGFLGCRHFSKTNAYLQTHGMTPIAW